ncbi:MAG: hypothetical protein NVSMB6_15560 [Burkholderiaceae bacterium]
MKLLDKVQITEVGPRDGLQNEPNNLVTEDKIEVVERPASANSRELEITFFVNPRIIPTLANAAEVVA